MATIAAFFPLACLLVSMAYKTPLENAASSRDKFASIFFANNNQSVACFF